MAYFVAFPSIKRLGTICSTKYDTLTEAVRVAMIHHHQGKFPTILCDDFGGFTASLIDSSRWARTTRTEWSLWFKSDGIYKSLPCRRAEATGVRYVSHSKGYRASLRGMYAFAADWDVFMASRGTDLT